MDFAGRGGGRACRRTGGCVQRLVGVVLEFEDLAAVGVGEGDDLLEWATGDGDAARAGKNAGGEMLHRVRTRVVADLLVLRPTGEQAVLSPAPGAGLRVVEHGVPEEVSCRRSGWCRR